MFMLKPWSALPLLSAKAEETLGAFLCYQWAVALMPEYTVISSEKYTHGREKRFILTFLEAQTAAPNIFYFFNFKSTVASPSIIRITAEREQQGIVPCGVT